ncbi:hypothetical protein FisN_27Lh101 [Fistulifera solaris]|uniref:AAA+ ATPase domain-containing protein n=1 Tax=Fistulifera solaris TaxID=1519565 RepID=A0A1Z5KAP8_FISSO|nr:hypothetical protein FisN_27Lh101 [Fistulifera solaris]|eukprot:GAX23327.1 hypothetical protein FisN_27Lh101 [Fistulifera solaris]
MLEESSLNASAVEEKAERMIRLQRNPPHPLTTFLLETNVDASLNDDIVAVPSILLDFLNCASRRISAQSKEKDRKDDSLMISEGTVSLCHLVEEDSFMSSSEESFEWYKDSVPIISLSKVEIKIRIQILLQEKDDKGEEIEDESKYGVEDNTKLLKEAFRGRFILPQSISLLQAPSRSLIVLIHEISTIDSSSICPSNAVFHLDKQAQHYQLELISSPWERIDHPILPTFIHATIDGIYDAPGYESTVERMRTLLQSPIMARPTGIVVTGCAGVGKTRVIQAALNNAFIYHWVSITDMLQYAAWQSEEEVFRLLQPPQPNVNIVVWDDLQDIYTSNDDDQESMEIRLLKNCLLQFLDRSRSVQHQVVIIGICREHQVPSEFTKTGRLEVVLQIPPPTQSQREKILMSWLQSFAEQVGVDNRIIQEWATRLAEVTPGCVAQDLFRLCSGARMRSRADEQPMDWNYLRDVAETCVPSQLAMLDVTKPRLSESIVDPIDRYTECWKALAGYESVKKRVFRTVALPWKRFMESPDSCSSFPPPRGVLFHGPSGCGKTLAAHCLGESLGLPMILVHASDILDKYVGGSEASLRSLFSRARSASPCILFMDEIDSIASNRAKDGDQVNVMSRLLSTLLNELDGVSSQSGQMLIVACTNRLDSLDAALLRPGRLEEHILLDYPTCSDINAILQTSLLRIPCDDEVNTEQLGVHLQGWTGARVAGVARDAILSWIRQTQGKQRLMKSHFPAEVLDVWCPSK